MYFQQFYLTCLSHASYILGSEGVACVVDPQRDVSLYLEEAAARGLEIQHIIETHLHADFVSGHVELAARTGAKLYLSDEGDASWKYVFAQEAGATLLKHGDRIRLGESVGGSR